MPFIHVELVEGRSQEQLTNMMKEITEAVHKNTGAPKEHIHVIINEMKKDSMQLMVIGNNLLDF